VHFIAEQFAKMQQSATEKTVHYFKKEEHNIARSVAIDAASGKAALLSKRKVDLLDAFGANKRVTAAVCVDLLRNAKTASLAAQSVTQDAIKPVSFAASRREMLIYDAVKNEPGIWPFHFWFEYKKGDIEKISAIMAYAESDLSKLSSETSFQELCKIALQLIQGLHSLHQKGYVHGDIKPENALIKREGGEIIIGLIDFSFAFNKESEEPTLGFKQGKYGSVTYTAPEVYGRGLFKGDYFKADIWALGNVLYRLYFKKAPPWDSAIVVLSKGAFRERKQLLNQQIEESCERSLKALLQKKSLKPEEQFECLIYQMLERNPAKRVDIVTALQQMEKIMAGQ
jgi:serine/threonine protein kinase